MFARGRALAPLLLAGALCGCVAPMQSAPPPVLSQPTPPPAEIPPPPRAAPPAPQPPPADEAGLRAQYGAPDFIRKETDSELWRYDGINCALFLFLYRENGTLRLRYMESLPRGASDPADPACVAGIETRVAPPSS